MGLAIGLGLGALGIGLTYRTAQASEIAPAVQYVSQASEVSSDDPNSFEDGVYLYGQVAQPDQLGAAYMVFQVERDRVVGAFYMPHSSFDCFYGEVTPQELALTIVDSYDRTAYPYAVALEQTSNVASLSGQAIAPVQLDGLVRLEALSANDERILGVCQTNYGDQL